MNIHHTYVIEIFENKDYPIVVHQFNGETREEALHYYRSHLKTDAFLNACVRSEKWGDVYCTSRMYWL